MPKVSLAGFTALHRARERAHAFELARLAVPHALPFAKCLKGQTGCRLVCIEVGGVAACKLRAHRQQGLQSSFCSRSFHTHCSFYTSCLQQKSRPKFRLLAHACRVLLAPGAYFLCSCVSPLTHLWENFNPFWRTPLPVFDIRILAAVTSRACVRRANNALATHNFLKAVRSPASHTPAGKQRRKNVIWDAHH